MGWTSLCATHYKNGKIDRKAECDTLFDETSYRVLRSSMRGTVYYAAIQRFVEYIGDDANGNPIYREIPKDERPVTAVVCPTSVSKSSYFNFRVKEISESMGPFYYDCPKCILDLLTPTDDPYALEWRKRCREKNNKKSKGEK